MLHFLPSVSYARGLALEGESGQLRAMPTDDLRELLARHAPRVPSLVFLCASCSEDVGRAFADAGVPVVVALRGLVPEEEVSRFGAALYRALLTGAPPRAAFDAARAEQVHTPLFTPLCSHPSVHTPLFTPICSHLSVHTSPFDAARAEQARGSADASICVRPAGEFCFLGADDAEGPTLPPNGELIECRLGTGPTTG